MRARRRTLALAWIVVFAAASGCGTIEAYQTDLVMNQQASEAFARGARPPGDFAAARHFERGWKQGYLDMAKGGNGAPPPLPPEAYWSFKYQNPQGQAAIQTWYQGYREGTQLAAADGVRQFNYLPSPHIQRPDSRLPSPDLRAIPSPGMVAAQPAPPAPSTSPVGGSPVIAAATRLVTYETSPGAIGAGAQAAFEVPMRLPAVPEAVEQR